LGGGGMFDNIKKRFAHYFLVRFEPTTSCQNNKQTNKQQHQKMGFEVGSLKNPRGLLACAINVIAQQQKCWLYW